ncbi:MAG: hypothetical protein AB1556_03865 [Bacillota bacterium]
MWDKAEEKKFFGRSLALATPEQLFYVTADGKYLAYWPNNYRGKKGTLQSRNSFVGSYTEKWVKEVITPVAVKISAFPVLKVECPALGLDSNSPADLAVCKTAEKNQAPENILLIVEVKMSIVWNWEYNPVTGSIDCLGDFRTHQGRPGLLRSDTMLKAIGKGINIRVSGHGASRIPIIVIGNTPITESYYSKVDHLKEMGIIQGFYSLNPNPLDNLFEDSLKSTPQKGFLRIDTYSELEEVLRRLLTEEREFFSGMKTKEELGKLIEIANKEVSYTAKAEKFLSLLKGEGN